MFLAAILVGLIGLSRGSQERISLIVFALNCIFVIFFVYCGISKIVKCYKDVRHLGLTLFTIWPDTIFSFI